MRFEIRMTPETAEKLRTCAEALGVSKTDVVLMGIDLVKSELDKE